MNSLKCRDKVVEINPLLLFHRICCVIENREELEEYLTFALTQQPPALFKDGVMRKGNKSELNPLNSHLHCLRMELCEKVIKVN